MAGRHKDPVSEMREDPFSGEWIIFAENRFGKPNDFLAVPPATRDMYCPFCKGNEEETPPPIQVYSEHNGDWRTRVVPNRYPAVSPVDLGITHSSILGSRRSAQGLHEVIVESPRHVPGFAELKDDEIRMAMRAYRDRLAIHRKSSQWAYAQIFKNTGPSAGASLSHTHAQLITLPFLPPRVKQREEVSREFYRTHQQCILCAQVESELEAGERIVQVTDNFVVYCPFASRFPFEVWIVPRHHASHFDALDEEAAVELGFLLRDSARRVQRVCSDSSLNVIIQTTSFAIPDAPWSHWCIELFPRVTKQAGFEWGTGCWINPVSPETAGKQLLQAG